MPRRLPSLNGLRAFEAAARHESFTRAAAELCVTQGAVSHLVKGLEAELGLKLFNRKRQRLVITEAGKEYRDVARDALDRIADGTTRLLQRQNSGALTVSTSPNFATKWLVHRLGRFAAEFPEIDLRISASLHHVDFVREDVDLAIRHGEGAWDGLHVTRLCAEERFPVWSPALARNRRGPFTPAALARMPLLHFNDRQDWMKWFQAAGLTDIGPLRGPVLDQDNMVIDAAVDGQGVALARTTLAARDLLAGRLIRPSPLVLPVPYAYWIVCSRAVAVLPKIVTFQNWLLAEAERDMAGLRRLTA